MGRTRGARGGKGGLGHSLPVAFLSGARAFAGQRKDTRSLTISGESIKAMNKKKIALITGANKGIGLETARQLGKQDITVLLGARDLKKGKAAAGGVRKGGVGAHA